MKSLILFTLILTTLSSCKNQSQESNRKLTPLSLWLVQNEDTLNSYFTEFIKGDPRLKGHDAIYLEYTIDTSAFKILNSKIAQYDSCIVVHINYRPKAKHPFEILLTSDYKKGCTSSIDKIFSDIDSLKHFYIVKYRPAEGLFGGYINDKDTINPEQIKFTINPDGDKYDLIFYTTKSIGPTSKEYLTHDIFGEEVLAKKINKVDYRILKDTTIRTKSIQEIRKYFGIPDE